jgi:hypothetical protein
MNPEDRIRMLMEENAMLRAQLQGRPRYDDYQGPASMPNSYGVTPEEYQADRDEAEAAAAASYMGNGMSDLMDRTPPRSSQYMRPGRKSPAAGARPTPYIRKDAKKPSGRSAGLD